MKISSTLCHKALSFLVLGAMTVGGWCLPAGAKSPRSAAGTKDQPACAQCVSRAASLFARGDSAQAAAVLRSMTAQCPNTASLHNLLSMISLRAGNKVEAENEGALAVAAGPASVPAHFQYAMALMSGGKSMQAAEQFHKVTELDPGNYEAWSALGSLYKELHQDSDAAQAMNRAANLEPATRASRLRTVTNLKRSGKYAQATEEIKRMLASSDMTPELAQDLAKEALLVGAFKEAQSACATVLSAYPNAAAPHMMAALAAYCSNDYDQCVQQLDAILSRDARNSDALALKGMALTKQNKLSDAAKAVEAASDVSSIAFLSKGTLAFANADYGMAEESLHSCLEQDASNNAMQGLPQALAHQVLADLYTKTGKTVLANEEKQALAKDRRFTQQ